MSVRTARRGSYRLRRAGLTALVIVPLALALASPVGPSAAAGTDPLMPPILEAVRARATLGEISDELRKVWGVYRPA